MAVTLFLEGLCCTNIVLIKMYKKDWRKKRHDRAVGAEGVRKEQMRSNIIIKQKRSPRLIREWRPRRWSKTGRK